MYFRWNLVSVLPNFSTPGSLSKMRLIVCRLNPQSFTISFTLQCFSMATMSVTHADCVQGIAGAANNPAPMKATIQS